MAKATNYVVTDAALTKLAEADFNCVLSAQPLNFYEMVDPNAWQASTAVSLNDAARPTTRNGYSYQATTAGTTAATEPTWPTTPTATVTDGTVVWTCHNNYALANGALTSGDFTIANGDTSGRKSTLGAKTGLSIHTTGTATHVGTADNATKEWLDVTTCTSQGLTAGGTVDTQAWDHEIGDPA